MTKSPIWQSILDRYGQSRTPLLFVISYDLQEFYIAPLSQLDPSIKFAIDTQEIPQGKSIDYHTHAVSRTRYRQAFDTIQDEIRAGNTYLTNLTFPSDLSIAYTLEEIYRYSDARFKLLFGEQFVCFSPERFVKIQNNTIQTHPMKGTIDASRPNAAHTLLHDAKEMAEHTMVVDLLRNDLSMVSTGVRVERFRYLEEIAAGERRLLQVSSDIRGDLEPDWQDGLGTLLATLLPAGSITGAPKYSTMKIIQKAEGYDRGFYSGVFGVFDGEHLDSAVMIRFIEKQGNRMVYKSGGGITIDSLCKSEYNEMCEKIYVPFL